MKTLRKQTRIGADNLQTFSEYSYGKLAGSDTNGENGRRTNRTKTACSMASGRWHSAGHDHGGSVCQSRSLPRSRR